MMRPPTTSAHGTAPGKVILLGEHAVVYGRTALAAAIDRSVDVTITPGPPASPALFVLEAGAQHAAPLQALARAAELVGVPPYDFRARITSNLPIGVGLGSSAALSVATVRALARFVAQPLDDTEVCAHAFEIEKLFHGFPSGIDNTVATVGGLIAFTRGAAPRPLAVRPLAVRRPIPLVVALGRTPRRTQQAVTALRERWTAQQDHYEALFDEIGHLVAEAAAALPSADFGKLGALMNLNQGLLRRLGVSTDELDHLVSLAGAHGALGAKLTGGGGGGAVICLCEDGRDQLVHAFERDGWCAFATDIGGQRGAHASDTDDMERRAVARA